MSETFVPCPPLDRLAVVGAGRMGRAVTAALPGAAGPFGRGFDGTDPDGAPYDVVLLCVPDREIASAAACIRWGPYVGHCSGLAELDVLAPHRAFSLHPLMTVTGAGGPSPFPGAGCAIAGATQDARDVAAALARRLGMTPTTVADADRAVYHAAASVAANFLLTVEAAAERLASHAGVPRESLVPLVRAAVDNWAAQGAERALTGPIARGDEDTVRRQRAAVAVREPDLLPLFDALADATRALARVETAVAQ
jgi:predicted short-subunit dehydrogenase-like oxidoreductase (DUF2520 family)